MAQSYRADHPRQVRCVLIADDLTGACDAAAPFRVRGAVVRALLDWKQPAKCECDVLSVNTESRDASKEQINARISDVAASLSPYRATIIFKKIDSALRGSPGEEIAAALRAFDREIAIIAPGFPQMGRRVLNGYLHSDRDPKWRPLHVKSLLEAQGLTDCAHVPANRLASVFEGSVPFISLDTNANEDLQSIVRTALECSRRVLWVGSGGLATALADTLFRRSAPQARAEQRPLPVLLAIGSDHAITTTQIEVLSKRCQLNLVHEDSTSHEKLVDALRSGRHTVLKIARGSNVSKSVASLLAECKELISGLLLSGGDTGALVCRGVGAHSIAIEGEIETGLPWGMIEGGIFNNVRVVTKSGAFGTPDALIKVADFFSCLPY